MQVAHAERVQLHRDLQGSNASGRQVRRGQDFTRADLRDHDIDCPKPARWLAQGAGGQDHTIAHAPIVLHDDFDVTGKVLMLQAIVADDHVNFGPSHQQRTDREPAPGMNSDRTPRLARDQRRFVAKNARI